jgi:hypothetical protein
MRKIRNISLALVIMPLLQTGCMQDKVSNIVPSKLADRNRTVNSNENDKDTILTKSSEDNSSDTSEIENQPYYIVVAEDNTTDTLNEIIEYQNSSSDEIVSTDTIIEMEDGWSELTKEDKIIETAKNFIGTKYVWAANGPDCFDCSGFTKYVFKENGITLPRYSGHQAQVGIKVSYNELQKGDLVFFDTEHKFRGKVNHVGIYIGDNKFIHASSAKKKVVITSFNEKPFYKRRFLKGERVINSDGNYASL